MIYFDADEIGCTFSNSNLKKYRAPLPVPAEVGSDYFEPLRGTAMNWDFENQRHVAPLFRFPIIWQVFIKHLL